MAIKHVARTMPPKKLKPSKCRSLEGDGGAGSAVVLTAVVLVGTVVEDVALVLVGGDTVVEVVVALEVWGVGVVVVGVGVVVVVVVVV